MSTLLIATEHAKTKAALAQSEANFDQAEKNLHRAETHFRQLREVVDRFGVHYAERLKDLPGAEPLRRELLLDTSNYYREFIQYAGDDPTLQADLAVYLFQGGRRYRTDRRQTGGACDAYRQATQAFSRNWRPRIRTNPQYRADLAFVTIISDCCLSATGKPAEAEEAYQTSAMRFRNNWPPNIRIRTSSKAIWH